MGASATRRRGEAIAFAPGTRRYAVGRPRSVMLTRIGDSPEAALVQVRFACRFLLATQRRSPARPTRCRMGSPGPRHGGGVDFGDRVLRPVDAGRVARRRSVDGSGAYRLGAIVHPVASATPRRAARRSA